MSPGGGDLPTARDLALAGRRGTDSRRRARTPDLPTANPPEPARNRPAWREVPGVCGHCGAPVGLRVRRCPRCGERERLDKWDAVASALLTIGCLGPVVLVLVVLLLAALAAVVMGAGGGG